METKDLFPKLQMSIRTLPATYKVDFSWDETNFFYRVKSNASLTI